jgi:hypothetical protein
VLTFFGPVELEPRPQLSLSMELAHISHIDLPACFSYPPLACRYDERSLEAIITAPAKPFRLAVVAARTERREMRSRGSCDRARWMPFIVCHFLRS